MEGRCIAGCFKKQHPPSHFIGAQRSGQPIYCIVDDAIASHMPGLRHRRFIQSAAYFHQSHLKGCQDYGASGCLVMLSCSGITLNYVSSPAINQDQRSRLYRRSRKNFPLRRSFPYFLCDEAGILQKWWTVLFGKVLYGWGIKDQPNPLSMRSVKSQCICPSFAENRPGISLVTVGSREFYVYRYEGVEWHSKCSGVILSCPKGWIWESQHCVYFSLQMQSYPAGDPGHLYETVAD